MRKHLDAELRGYGTEPRTHHLIPPRRSVDNLTSPIDPYATVTVTDVEIRRAAESAGSGTWAKSQECRPIESAPACKHVHERAGRSVESQNLIGQGATH